MSIARPPSPDMEITCRSGMADLRTDGLRQGIGHRPVVERAEQPALAVHRQITRGPDRRRAHVAGENRVFGRELDRVPARHIEDGSVSGRIRRSQARRAPCALSGSARATASNVLSSSLCFSFGRRAGVSSSTSPTNPKSTLVRRPICSPRTSICMIVAPWERTADKENPFRSSAADRSSSSRDSPKRSPSRPVMPTSNGLSYSMNSLPRIACTIGACSLPASSINSSCAPAQPAPPRIVIFFAPFEQVCETSQLVVGRADRRLRPANCSRGSCSTASRKATSPGSATTAHAAFARSRSAWRFPGRAASARAATPARSSGCTARKDAPDASPGNIRCRFRGWEFARRSPEPARGCGGNRRAR